MQLNANVFDFWVFRRTPDGVRFLVVQASALKAQRYFNGGTFWQVPSGVFRDDESVPQAAERELAAYQLKVRTVWAAEHAYTIYNRRFHQVQVITVFAVEVAPGDPTLRADEHQAFAWLPYDDALARVHFRGLKDGLRSVQEYITGVERPAPELCLSDPDPG
jgi:8-oxo-dGTP pyrophosphatase MutT (NUDIX family)